MRLRRRSFLKLTAAGAAGAVARPSTASARPAVTTGSADAVGVLVDTSNCLGCRACEAACAEQNALAGPDPIADAQVFDRTRPTSPGAFTVVNRSREAGDARFVKTQCMHCVEPACATACPVRALEKTPAGPVVYHVDRCLGCRYCMVACPFDVPKYTYDTPTPAVRKCIFCQERLAQGLEPACTTVCPSGALQFGKRAALLEEARRRVYGQPDKYVPHIYGEREAGGTSWMYIGDRQPEQMGLKANVPMTPYSSLAQGALSAVPLIITLWPPLLMGLYTFSQRRGSASGAPAHEEDRHV
jgi:Fe-S-cluster-containing dehydrogenase component